MRSAALFIALAAALALGGLVWLLYAWPRRTAGDAAPIEPEPGFVTALRPDQTGFEMVVVGQPSISKKSIALQGRLQVFVKAGSQYATWRQFPSAVQFEIVAGPQGPALLPDQMLSISDSNESYARYAALPSNRIVGQDFTFDLFPGNERGARLTPFGGCGAAPGKTFTDERRDHCRADLVLQGEDTRQLAIEGPRPDVVAVGRRDELGGDADPLRVAAHAALEQVGDVELLDTAANQRVAGSFPLASRRLGSLAA